MKFLTAKKGMDMTTGKLLPKLLAFALPLALSGVLPGNGFSARSLFPV